MTDYRDRIKELTNQARRLADGPSKLAILEEAVRLADTHQDVETGFNLRNMLIRAATFSGAEEKALVTFTWQLAQCDRDPQRFNERGLLWQYKWVIHSLPDFPQITRQQMDESFADMERRYKRNGLGLRPVWKERCRTAKTMDHRDEAREYYQRWRKTRADWGNDCAACERQFQVDYLIYANRPRQALTTAAPLLEGRQRCATIPQTTLGTVLEPLFKLGRVEEAMACHLRGYRMVSNNRDFIEEAAEHMLFLTLTDNTAPAVKLLEKHLAWGLETMVPHDRFQLYLACRFLLARLADGDKETLRLRLPKSFPIHREDSKYEVAALLKWFDEACRELAARFDARNGNDYYTRRINQQVELKKIVAPHPIKKT